MKECTGLYSHKGFNIYFSESNQVWEIEPKFLFDMYEDKEDEVIDFLEDLYNSERFEGFKTINKAKKWIDENEEQIKQDLIKEFERMGL